MKKLIFVLVSVSLIMFSSCIPLSWSRSKFTSENLYLGMYQREVVEKFGKPFKMDGYKKGSDIFEVYYYKEVVNVGNSSYEYILTTVLTFQKNILIDIKQVENDPPNSVIRMK